MVAMPRQILLDLTPSLQIIRVGFNNSSCWAQGNHSLVFYNAFKASSDCCVNSANVQTLS